MKSKANFIGGKSIHERVEGDFYSTPLETTMSLLCRETLPHPVWEPACGDGMISRLIDDCISTDLFDRGYGTPGIDFLTTKEIPEVNTIITNPPFKLWQEFGERALSIAKQKVIMFGRIQCLEGMRRGSWLESSPLRCVYVFKQRQSPYRNGEAFDSNGKLWPNMLAFAWFVWEHGHVGDPIIKWI